MLRRENKGVVHSEVWGFDGWLQRRGAVAQQLKKIYFSTYLAVQGGSNLWNKNVAVCQQGGDS